MKVIGITGGAGCGKTHVVQLLADYYSAAVIDTDTIAKQQMKSDGVSFSKVVKVFGEHILDESGEINRKKLAEIVFCDDRLLQRLNELTHPSVTETVLACIEKTKVEGIHPFILIETAILRKAGYISFCDEVWYVYAGEEERRMRLRKSRGYTNARIDALFSKQDTEEEFRSYCTRIINNGNEMTEDGILNQVKAFLL